MSKKMKNSSTFLELLSEASQKDRLADGLAGVELTRYISENVDSEEMWRQIVQVACDSTSEEMARLVCVKALRKSPDKLRREGVSALLQQCLVDPHHTASGLLRRRIIKMLAEERLLDGHTVQTLCESEHEEILISGLYLLRDFSMVDAQRILDGALVHRCERVRLSAFLLASERPYGNAPLLLETLRGFLREDFMSADRQEQALMAFDGSQDVFTVGDTLVDWVRLLSSTALNTHTDERLRMACCDAMAEMIKNATSQFRRSDVLLVLVFDTGVQMLRKTPELPLLTDFESITGHGMRLLDTLCSTVPSRVYHIVRAAVVTLATSAETWQEKDCLLFIVTATLDGCREFWLSDLEIIVPIISALLSDAHPKVRFAAVTAVGTLALNMCPAVQLGFPEELLAPLLSLVSREQMAETKKRVCDALESWCDPELPFSCISPYVERILKEMTALVAARNNSSQTKGAALTTIASLAAVSKREFVSSYPGISSAVRSVLETFDGVTVEDIHVGALACIAETAKACGYDQFKDDAAYVIDKLKQVHEAESLSHDQMAQLVVVWSGVSASLRSRFLRLLPYVASVLSPLIRVPQFSYGGMGADDGADFDDLSVTKITIASSEVEQIVAGVDVLGELASQHGAQFVSRCGARLLPQLLMLIPFPHPKLRLVAAGTIAALFKKAAGDRRLLASMWTEECQQIILSVLETPLEDVAPKQVFAGLLQCVKRCLATVPRDLISQSFIGAACGAAEALMGRLRLHKMLRVQAEGLFEDPEEFVVLGAVCNMHGPLAEKACGHPGVYEHSGILQHLMMLVREPLSAEDVVLGISMLGDVVEHLHTPDAVQFWTAELIPLIFKTLHSANIEDDAVYVCCHVLGAFIQFSPADVSKEIIEACFDMLRQDGCSREVTSVGALGKMLLYKRDHIAESQFQETLYNFLCCLPIKTNKAEARVAHELFLEMLEGGEYPLDPQDSLRILGCLLDDPAMLKDCARRVERHILSAGAEAAREACAREQEPRIWRPFQRRAFLALLCCHNRADSVVARLPRQIIYIVLSPLVVPPGAVHKPKTPHLSELDESSNVI